jgi:5-methylcytosine-specific restriction endonuclease McrA
MTYIPDALRREVWERARGRCEYCHLHEDNSYYTHEIDHIYAEKHGGETLSHNLCLACALCNRYKGSDLCSLDPQTGAIAVLFHPRRDPWTAHFRLARNGQIDAHSATGRVTIKVLGLNRVELVADRTRLIALGAYNMESG